MSNFPECSLFCMERSVDHQGNTIVRKHSPHNVSVPGVIKAGVVKGKEASNILLHTG